MKILYNIKRFSIKIEYNSIINLCLEKFKLHPSAEVIVDESVLATSGAKAVHVSQKTLFDLILRIYFQKI
jgi:hypothetical protein